MTEDRDDIVIVGSGPCGGAMAWKLAKTGRRVLVVERGDDLKRERQNRETGAIFVEARCQTDETWTSSSGEAFKSDLPSFAGGKSDGAQIEAEGLPALPQWLPDEPVDGIARHSVDLRPTSEDLPKPQLYAAGSEGPAASDALRARAGHSRKALGWDPDARVGPTKLADATI